MIRMFPLPAIAPVRSGIALFFLFALYLLSGIGFCNEPPKQVLASTETGIKMPVGKAAALPCPEIKVNGSVARAGLLYDLTSNQVVWEKNMKKVYPIASLTKMMVVLLVTEDIHAGKLSADKPVQVTREATAVGGSSVCLKAGQFVTVEDLLKAALVNSGNDAAYLLAQHSGGTEAAFVNRMNRRAAQLGMENTRFSNSTGMPASRRANDNSSSPSDLLKLAIEMLKYDELLEIASISQEFIAQGNSRLRIRNHNHLVEAFEEIDGFKTGFTLNAKFCLVATSCKDGRRLVSIALGVPSSVARNRFVADMINSYYEELGVGSLSLKSAYAYQRYVGDHRSSPARAKGSRLVASADGSAAVHKIRKGDTLYLISKKYKCSVADLQKWNNLKGSSIKPGQKLKIKSKTMLLAKADTTAKSKSKTTAKASATRKSKAEAVIYHTVRPGDTLWNIASKYQGVTVNKLMQTNGISRSRAKNLKPGTMLKIATNA